MYRSILTGILLALIASTSVAFGQGEVYLFGQLVGSRTSAKIAEATRMKTENSIVTFDTNYNPKVKSRLAIYNNSTRLQLSSITKANSYHNLSAAITKGSVPSGTTLKLAIIDPNSNFNGESGSSGSEITLNNTDKIILSEIGTCNSGKKPDDGYGIGYSFISQKSLQNIKELKENITVTLTITTEV